MFSLAPSLLVNRRSEPRLAAGSGGRLWAAGRNGCVLTPTTLTGEFHLLALQRWAAFVTPVWHAQSIQMLWALPSTNSTRQLVLPLGSDNPSCSSRPFLCLPHPWIPVCAREFQQSRATSNRVASPSDSAGAMVQQRGSETFLADT